MLKRIALGSCLLALAACASAPTSPDKTAATAAVRPPAGCVGQTATRIPVKDGQCAGFGNTYTEQDIRRTGQVSADKALGMLDPSVRVVGH